MNYKVKSSSEISLREVATPMTPQSDATESLFIFTADMDVANNRVKSTSPPSSSPVNAMRLQHYVTNQLHLNTVELMQYIVSARELLRDLHLSRRLVSVLQETTVRRFLRNYADVVGLSVNDSELLTASNEFRRNNGLLLDHDFNTWLEKERIKSADFQEAIKRDILVEKLCVHLTCDHIVTHFNADPSRYDRVFLTEITVSSGPVAHALAKAMQGQNHTPVEASNKQLNCFFRHQLPGHTADTVFSKQPGTLVGPFDLSDRHYLYVVDNVKQAQLDEQTTDRIRQELFRSWIDEQLSEYQIDSQFLNLL